MNSRFNEYIENTLENNLNNSKFNELLENELNTRQNDFLNSQMGQAINKGLDFGIKIILPEAVSEQVIDLKNNILEGDAAFGLKDLLTNAIIDGRNNLGLNNNNYESINQAKKVVEEGKVLDKVYDFIDSGINELKDEKKIDTKTAKKLTDEKEIINENLENQVEESFNKQLKNFEKLEKYISKWKNCFQNQDFSGMQKEYYKMNTVMKEILPLENTIKEYRYVENMQKLIKNNNKSFDLTEEAQELSEKLFN